MRLFSKRCLIRLQKGVSKGLKGHLLQGNQASFRSQLSIYWFWDGDFFITNHKSKSSSPQFFSILFCVFILSQNTQIKRKNRIPFLLSKRLRDLKVLECTEQLCKCISIVSVSSNDLQVSVQASHLFICDICERENSLCFSTASVHLWYL